MMKHFILILLIILMGLASYTQVSNDTIPKGWKLLKNNDVPVYKLPNVDVESLKVEDIVNDKFPKPFRFGYKHLVDFGLNDDEDGICGDFGNGSYELTTDNNTVIYYSDNFGSTELTEFRINSDTSILELNNEKLAVYPNSKYCRK